MSDKCRDQAMTAFEHDDGPESPVRNRPERGR